MKLQTNRHNIERGGVHSETAFTIKTNALSFSILSSGLYTDPIMAIVRELSCNAYDAHVAANNAATPFEIHLPNELEPFLSIKDFGTGLSDEDIQGELIPVEDDGVTIMHTRTGGLYTTYFDSSKTTSNDYIGALGLGSKSPFSYSDAFEVISTHGGHKRTYAIFLNEEGIPTVALMGTMESDEHTGLEVKIAIKKDDFYKFSNKTATALKYFRVKPIIHGAISFEFDKVASYRIQTSEWILSQSTGYYSSTLVAVQGNVQYRVEPSQIKDMVSGDVNTFISRTSIILFFDIGELEVAANREEIRYDERSQKAIADAITDVYENLTGEIERRIGKINNNYWYACLDLNDLSNEIFNNKSFIREHTKEDKVKNSILKRYIKQNGKIVFDRIYGFKLFRYKLAHKYNDVSVKRTSVGAVLSPLKTMGVIINDVKTGGIKRLADYLNEHNIYNEALLITQYKTHIPELDYEDNLIPYVGFDKELKNIIKTMGNPTVLRLSEITTVPTREKVVSSVPIYTYGGMYNSYTSTYYRTGYVLRWNKISHDFEDGGIYVPLKYGKKISRIGNDNELITFGDANENSEELAGILRILVDEYNIKHGTEYDEYNIFGLPAIACKRAQKIDKWVNLLDFAPEVLLKYKDDILYYHRLNNTPSFLGIKKVLDNSYRGNLIDMLDELTQKSVFKKAVSSLLKTLHDTSLNKNDKLVNLAALELYLNNDNSGKYPPFYTEETFDKYGMLPLIQDLDYATNWKTLTQYIKLVDRSK